MCLGAGQGTFLDCLTLFSRTTALFTPAIPIITVSGYLSRRLGELFPYILLFCLTWLGLLLFGDGSLVKNGLFLFICSRDGLLLSGLLLLNRLSLSFLLFFIILLPPDFLSWQCLFDYFIFLHLSCYFFIALYFLDVQWFFLFGLPGERQWLIIEIEQVVITGVSLELV